MSVSRRDFVKLCSGTVAGFGVSQMFNPSIIQALTKGAPRVIWLQGLSCTGCSISILNAMHPSIADVLLKVIQLEYHPTLMGSSGENAFNHLFKTVKNSKDEFVLIVEGAIPSKDDRYCVIGDRKHKEYTLSDTLRAIAPLASAVVAVGSCSAFGGIPAAAGNQTGATSVTNFFKTNKIKTPVVNVPGCPPHPDWMVGSLVYLLENGVAATVKNLDSDGRPKMFYGNNVHDNCPYLPAFDNGDMNQSFPQDEKMCRYDLGCKGPNAYCDSYKRLWNGGVNWCVRNGVCIACVESGFPDASSPFYVAG